MTGEIGFSTGGEIFELLPKIADEIGAIGKNGYNDKFTYDFRKIDDVITAVHPVFVKYGITPLPRTLSKETSVHESKSGGIRIRTMISVRYYLVASDGSYVFADAEGDGMDSEDKGTSKAASDAFKDMLGIVFSIPFPGRPENDQDDRKKNQRPATTPQPTAPANPAQKPSAKAPAPTNSDVPFFDAAGNELGMLTWDGSIPSRFDNGGCKLCGKRHIPQGDPIVNLKGIGYAALSCAEAHNAALTAPEPKHVDGGEDLPF